MGIFFSSEINSLDELLVQGLKSIYYAERQIAEALPKMIDMATNPELKSAFQQHLTETEEQRRRLEQIFSILGTDADEGSCPAIDGIVKDANEVAGRIEDKSVLDAALAYGAQQVEHHEIAVYGTLIAWAREVGPAQIVPLLETTLQEEKSTDERLTRIAEMRLNAKADATGTGVGSDATTQTV